MTVLRPDELDILADLKHRVEILEATPSAAPPNVGRIFDAGISGGTHVLASGAAFTWVTLGSFTVGDDHTSGRMTLSGGDKFQITDLESYSIWQISTSVRFHPTSGAGGAGSLGLAISNGTSAIIAASVIPIIAGDTAFYTLSVSIALSSANLSASGKALRVRAFQDSGINYNYADSDNADSFSAVFINEFS